MEKDLDLVILTSDTLFQRVKVSLYLLRLLTLQLNNGPTIKADPTVYVEDLMLLFVDGGVDIVLHIADDSEPVLQSVQSHIQCRNSIVEAVVGNRHSGLQFLITLLGSLYLINQIGPDIVQHLDRTVGLSCVDIELPQESGHLSHSPDQILTLAQLVLVIRIKRLANAVARRMV